MNPDPTTLTAASPATAAPPALVVVLANPFSGAKANKKRVEQFTAALSRRGLESRVLWTPTERDAALQDPELAARCRCLVAAGGDGTAASIFNRRLDLPVAVLPLGNENLLAKEIGLRGGPDHLADAIAAGRTRCIDLGQLNQRRFAIVASAGLDAAVVHQVDRWRQAEGGLRRIRRISYTRPIVQAFMQYPCPPLTVEADGRRIDGVHALVFNINRYGGGLSFAPDARGDDGLLDYVVFTRPGRFNLTRYLAGVAIGAHRGMADVAAGRAAKIRITAETAIPLQTDGDSAGETPAEISTIPRALRVIVG